MATIQETNEGEEKARNRPVVRRTGLGEIAYANSYGMADLEQHLAIGPDTAFNISSVSKQFTAFAIASLAVKDQLSMDDDIRKYCPEMNDFAHSITIRHLVHQTSGLRNCSSLHTFVGRSSEVRTQERMLDIIRQQKELNFKPGEEYQDSSTNYVLLATIVERVTGKSYRDWIREHVFAPLKMTNSDVLDDQRIIATAAFQYSRRGTIGFQKNVSTDFSYGSGGIYCSAIDLASWLRYLHHPPAADVPAIELLFQRGVLDNGEAIDSAFGLNVERFGGLRRIGSAGDDVGYAWWYGSFKGYTAYAGFFPEQDFGVVVLSNESPLAYDKAMQIAEKYLGEHFDEKAEHPGRKSKIAVTVESDALDAIVGDYLSSSGGTRVTRDGNEIYVATHFVVVTPQEGSLRARIATGRRKSPIFPASDTDFFYGQFDTWLHFVKNKDGRVVYFDRVGFGDVRARRLTGESFFARTSQELSSFVGAYTNWELNTSFSLAMHDKSLVAEHQYFGGSVLARLSENIFYAPFGVVRFERDVKGQITGFRLTNTDDSVRNLLFDRDD